MKAQVKISNSFGNKGMVLETDGEQFIVSVNDAHISHSELVEYSVDGDNLITWKQSFEGLIKDVINLATDNLFLGMTADYQPRFRRATGEQLEGPNFGLWVVIKEENNTACYWLSPVEDQ